MGAPYFTLSTKLSCWSPLSPAAVEERLQEAIARGALAGTSGDGRFELARPLPRRNSWRPMMRGRLVAHAGGTAVDVELGVAPLVFVFTVFHGLFFLGLSWLLAVFAFSSEVEGAQRALLEAIDATVARAKDVAAPVEVADPEEPGSETRAPPSIRPRPERDRVEFPLDLAADAAGIEFGRAGARVAWERIARVTYDEQVRMVRIFDDHGQPLAAVPAGAIPADDARWLTRWISARADRRRGSADDAAPQAYREVRRLVGDVER